MYIPTSQFIPLQLSRGKLLMPFVVDQKKIQISRNQSNKIYQLRNVDERSQVILKKMNKVDFPTR